LPADDVGRLGGLGEHAAHVHSDALSSATKS
jgi:hypothetical protein